MAYMSLVTIAIPEDSDHPVDLFRKVDPNCRISTLGDIKYIEYDWLVWYLESPCDPILAVMSYLEELGRENYGFIRLGQDSEDVTYMGSPNEFGLAVDSKIIIVPYRHKILSKI